MSDTPKPSETDPVPLKTLATDKTGALHPEDSVKTAGDRMRERDTTEWPVAEDSRLIGTIGGQNPDWQTAGRGHDPASAKVGDIMRRELVFCYEDQDCAAAQKLMDERDLRYLPVVDREMRIVGIFSRQEVTEKADAAKDAAQTAIHPDAGK